MNLALLKKKSLSYAFQAFQVPILCLSAIEKFQEDISSNYKQIYRNSEEREGEGESSIENLCFFKGRKRLGIYISQMKIRKNSSQEGRCMQAS